MTVAGFAYVGPVGAAGSDLLTRSGVDQQYANAPVSQGAVAAQVTAAVSALATQTSVNNALNAYVQPAAITAQTALLLPTSQIGVPSIAADPTATPPTLAVTGVASLDSTGKVPLAQLPAQGAGYLSGPWGPTATFSAAASTVPAKIADWNLGATGVSFYPRAWMSLLVAATNLGRPVVEVWMSNAQMTYGQGILVARGMGRDFWNDLMTVNVVPMPSRAGQVGGSGYSPTYTAWFTAWLYDLHGEGVSVLPTNIATAGVYLYRYTQ